MLYLNLRGGEIAVTRKIIDPDYPTIIFLHDSLGCIELWRDFPEKLGVAANCNVVVYDRHGYGRSGPFVKASRDNNYLEVEADVLSELITELGLDRVILFGHSDGGSIALLAAAKYPAIISAVITEGAHVFVEEETVRGIREAAELYRTTNLKQKLEKYHGGKTGKMFSAWADTWMSTEFRSWNIERFLPSVVCPVLVLQCEDDEYGTISQVDAITSKVSSKASGVIIKNAKHTPHKENQEIALQVAAEFILSIKL